MSSSGRKRSVGRVRGSSTRHDPPQEQSREQPREPTPVATPRTSGTALPFSKQDNNVGSPTSDHYVLSGPPATRGTSVQSYARGSQEAVQQSRAELDYAAANRPPTSSTETHYGPLGRGMTDALASAGRGGSFSSSHEHERPINVERKPADTTPSTFRQETASQTQGPRVNKSAEREPTAATPLAAKPDFQRRMSAPGRHDPTEENRATTFSPTIRQEIPLRTHAAHHHDSIERPTTTSRAPMAAGDPVLKDPGPLHPHQATGDLTNTTDTQYPARTVEVPGTRLSVLADSFARINYLDFKNCARFVADSPEILQENKNAFLEDAFTAYCHSYPVRAEACIQQGLLIQECAGLTKHGIRDYFADLDKRKPSAIQPFLQKFDKLKALIKARAEESQKPDQTRMESPGNHPRHVPPTLVRGAVSSIGQSPTLYNQYPDKQRLRPETMTEQETSQSSVRVLNPHHGPTSLPPISEFDVFQSQSRRHEASKQQHPQHILPPNGPPNRPPNRPRSNSTISRSNASAEEGNSISEVTLSSMSNKETIEIRGTDGVEEKLDRRYRMRFDAKTFFSVGRVFALLWHENAGASMKKEKRGEDVGILIHHIKGPYGQIIYSHIRRMVVVNRKKGCCWCIPINTYGGRGVKPNMSQADIEAHTIVHESDRPPVPIVYEPKLIKDPIAVEMAPNQELGQASRLNFAKVHTVEWNVKVMNIGKVAKNSMAKLEAYWHNEVAGQIPT